jgi:hypothetical protein
LALTVARIAQLIDEISIASLRSWLKSQGFEHSANTREQMAERLLKLLQNKSLSEEELESAVSNIEEASSKRIALCELPEVPKHLQTPAEFGKHLNGADKKLSQKPQRAPKLPSNPTLVYVTHSQNHIRAKWAETQTRIEVDYTTLEISQKKVTKVVVMVADLKTRLIQLRYDKPEIRHIHKTKDDYLKYYRQQATALLGVEFSRFEIREALRSLVDTEPRVVRIRVNEHRSKTDKSVRFVDRKGHSDVRDDPEWKAAYEAGSTTRAYDDQAVYWLPSASNGVLNREVFTDIDAVSSTVRVDADCHEDEIDYAVSTIRKHQI